MILFNKNVFISKKMNGNRSQLLLSGSITLPIYHADFICANELE